MERIVNSSSGVGAAARARLSPAFVGHDIYRHAGYSSQHPLGIARVGPVMDLCAALGWFGPGEFRESPRATDDDLVRFHTPEYVHALRTACSQGHVPTEVRERHRIGTMENPLFPQLFERAATSVGGSMHAARLALEGRIAYHPPGGTHHGRPDRASGFCYFNDPVFAILGLLDGGLSRVLYVDLDAHHCDAVQDAFAADRRVFTLSIHERGRWPYTGRVDERGAGRACNLPVPRGFHDAELDLVMRAVILPLVDAVSPQAVVLTCGADALAGDPLAKLELSNTALWRWVTTLAHRAPRAVVLGGGGYNPWTVARYWTGLWACLSGRDVPRELPPTARAILAQLSCDLVEEEDVRPEWRTTLADAPSDQRTVRAEVMELIDTALALVDHDAFSGAASRGRRSA